MMKRTFHSAVHILSRLRARWRQLNELLAVAQIDLRDRLLARPVTGSAAVAVALTSHKARIAKVHTTLQCIVAGTVRPARLILYLNAEEQGRELGAPLRRLQRRGLEIRYVRDYGPHTKYFPYVLEASPHRLPLVTADDDILYPKRWLQALVDTAAHAPQHIHAHWAKRVVLRAESVAPYTQWSTNGAGPPSPLNFAMGVAGVWYPPSFLDALRRNGDTFLRVSPRADDIWLHAVAVRSGHQIKQTGEKVPVLHYVPMTQQFGLWHQNVSQGGNDLQIDKTYTAADIQNMKGAVGMT